MLHQNNRNEGNGRVSLRDFLNLNPRVFTSPTEPLDTDDWLREMNKTLVTSHMAPEDRVPYVTFLHAANPPHGGITTRL